jgi:tRNA G37 N-methylase Trm5
MGRGRHALVLAKYGFRVFGVDLNHDAVRGAVVQASANGLVVRGWCAD